MCFKVRSLKGYSRRLRGLTATFKGGKNREKSLWYSRGFLRFFRYFRVFKRYTL